jgi:hypothetical protein
MGTIGFLDFFSRVQWGYRVSFSLKIELFLVGPISSIVTATWIRKFWTFLEGLARRE